MDEKLENRLRNRWSKLEDRIYQITCMLDELEDVGRESEEISIKTTSVYMVLEKEIQTAIQEQKFIESLWK